MYIEEDEPDEMVVDVSIFAFSYVRSLVRAPGSAKTVTISEL
jgi:hypothetical protein